MHISLTIFPIQQGHGPNSAAAVEASGYILGHDRLSFGEDWRIFGQIIDVSEFAYADESWPAPVVSPLPLPSRITVQTYGEEGMEELGTSDLDGELPTYLPASEFGKIEFPSDTKPVNLAIKAFLDALPPETMIVMYWSV